MLKKQTFFLCSFWLALFLLVSGTNSVSAQTPEPTPSTEPTIQPTATWCGIPCALPATQTTTWEPLLQTETPEAEINMECPDYLPENYLTKTPNPYWEAQCGHCATNVKSEGGGGIDNSNWAPEYQIEELGNLNGYKIGLTGNLHSQAYNWPGGFSLLYFNHTSGSIPYKVIGTVYTGHNEGHSETSIRVNGGDMARTGSLSTSGRCFALQIWGNTNNVSVCNLVYPSASTSFLISSTPRAANNTLHSQFLLLGRYNSGGTGFVDSMQAIVIIPEDQDFDIEDTNAPPPDYGSGGYCASIQGYEDLTIQDNGEIGISLPNIQVGQASCMSFGGQILDLTVLNLIPGINDIQAVQIPQIQICARPISFGTLNLIGVQLDMDIFAFVLAMTGIIRMLFRS